MNLTDGPLLIHRGGDERTGREGKRGPQGFDQDMHIYKPYMPKLNRYQLRFTQVLNH
jgi:hypothetical protein